MREGRFAALSRYEAGYDRASTCADGFRMDVVILYSYFHGKTDKINSEFNYSNSDLAREGGIANKRVIVTKARFEAFFGCKIVPDFTIFDQKRTPNGHLSGAKRGFFATKFVKTCQVRSLVSTGHWSTGCFSRRARKEKEGSLGSVLVKRKASGWCRSDLVSCHT